MLIVLNPLQTSQIPKYSELYIEYKRFRNGNRNQFLDSVFNSEKEITTSTFVPENVSELSGLIQFSENLSETIKQNLTKFSEKDIRKNRYIEVLLSILKKNQEICRNIGILLNNQGIYGAYSLLRNLYEMDVVTWSLFHPIIDGNNLELTNLLLKRYTDYTAIEQASVNNIGTHIRPAQYIQLDEYQKQLYDAEQAVISKYNSEDREIQKHNRNKLLKPYDWANSLFLDVELERMHYTPTLFSLVQKSEKITGFFINLYPEYVSMSGYIHSSYLSTQFAEPSTESIRYIKQITYQIMEYFLSYILLIPEGVVSSLLHSGILSESEEVKRQRFYYQVLNFAFYKKREDKK